MSYPFQDIVALDSATAYTTIVLDYLENKKSNVLKRQFELMFRSNAYCYIKKEETAELNDETCAEIQNLLNERIVNERSLLNTNYHFSFAFFMEVRDLDTKRIDSVLSFLKGMKRFLAAPGLQIYSYLLVCKDNQNTEQAMKNFDQCVEKLLEGSDVDTPRLVIIDTLPLAKADPWLRASVRALNALSCDNPLSTSLRSMGKTIWNWSMTEFDVQAKDEENRIRDEIIALLYGSGEFPLGKLERNFGNLISEIYDTHERDLRFNAENMPIPSNVIGGVFRKKALQANIPAFVRSIERSFYENVTMPILGDIASTDRNALCDKLLFEIPLNMWTEVAGQLRFVQAQEDEKPVESLEDYPRRKISLEVQSKIEDMRTSINGELNRSIREIKQYVPSYLKFVIRECLPDYIDRNLSIRRTELQERLQSLGTASIIAKDAQDYLKRLNELNNQVMSVSYTKLYDQNIFILISDDTFNLWQNSYQSALNLMGCQVYNYHSLEEFEFQTLILTSWRLEEYRLNREYIFKQ